MKRMRPWCLLFLIASISTGRWAEAKPCPTNLTGSIKCTLPNLGGIDCNELQLTLSQQCTQTYLARFNFIYCNPNNFTLTINATTSYFRSEYKNFSLPKVLLPFTAGPNCYNISYWSNLTNCDSYSWARMKIVSKSSNLHFCNLFVPLNIIPQIFSPSPTYKPSVRPTNKPTAEPSRKPTSNPAAKPFFFSNRPTIKPAERPSAQPSTQPTAIPSAKPSSPPTAEPNTKPSAKPTAKPTPEPSTQPSAKPTHLYMSMETKAPSTKPFVRVRALSTSSDGNDRLMSASECQDSTEIFSWSSGSPVDCSWVKYHEFIGTCLVSVALKYCPVTCNNCRVDQVGTSAL